MSVNEVTGHLLGGIPQEFVSKEKRESCLKIQRLFRENRVLRGALLCEKPVPDYSKNQLMDFFKNRNYYYVQQEIIDRAESIRKSLAGDYYAFSHGTKGSIGFFHDIFTGLDQQNGCVPLAQKRFRIPGVAKEFTNFEAYRKSDISKQIDNFVNHSVIAVDGYLQKKSGNESAWSFFTGNSSITDVEKELPEQLIAYVSKRAKIQNYLREQIQKGLERIPKSGRYYLIAIPKDHIENPENQYVWRSHGRGFVCSCKKVYSRKDHFTYLLKENQKGNGETCDRGGIPQYRMLAHNLDQDQGKKVFSFNLLSADNRKKHTEIVVKVKREIRFFRNLEAIQNDTPVEKIVTAILNIDFRIQDPNYWDGIQEILKEKETILKSHERDLLALLPSNHLAFLKLFPTKP
jgi:hypothetical protein